MKKPLKILLFRYLPELDLVYEKGVEIKEKNYFLFFNFFTLLSPHP